MPSKKKPTGERTWKGNKELERFLVPLATLHEDPANARQHNERNIQLIIGSLQEFGQQLPIIATAQGKIIAGNGRHRAMIGMGWTHVAAITFDSEEAARQAAYSIVDNRTAETATWDSEALAAMLGSLKDEYDLDNLIGFDAEDLAHLDINLDPDAADLAEPEPVAPPANPQTKPGDLWHLGPHRVLCADATQPDSYRLLLGDALVDLVCTDPPYGVAMADKNEWLNSLEKGRRVQKKMEGDHGETPETAESLWGPALEHACTHAKRGAVLYCFAAQGGNQMMMMMMVRAKWNPTMHQLIWVKNNHVLGRTDYQYKHEPILYTWKDQGHKWYGGFQTSVLEYPKPQKSEHHPSMKPVALIARLIENSTKPDDLVLDMFGGSGTTLLAAHQLNRSARLLELTPEYTDVICQRFYDLTGLTPTRENGPSFVPMKKET